MGIRNRESGNFVPDIGRLNGECERLRREVVALQVALSLPSSPIFARNPLTKSRTESHQAIVSVLGDKK